MKKKNLSSILVIGLICTSLTGCVSFSYGNPVKEETYVAELPDGEVVVLDKEEAEELQRAQDELQEELGISDEELEALREDIAGYEDEETVEDVEEETVEEQKSFNLSEELGRKIGTTSLFGIDYEIYEHGAKVEEVLESFATIPEEIEYEGTTYPVVCLADVYEEWTEFNIPSHIKYIDDVAFGGSAIKSLNVPDTVIYMSGSRTFSGSSIEELTFNDSILTNEEWWDTFHNCYNLKSVSNLPNGIVTLKSTFDMCKSLESVSLSDSIEIIGDNTFHCCEKLSEIIIPSNVKEIDTYAFSNTPVKELNLPDGLTTISMGAFEDMNNLEEIIIPDSVTSYSNNFNVHGECPSLKKIKYSNNAEYWIDGYDYNTNLPNLELIIYPDNLTDLDEGAFKNIDTTNLTIQVPENAVGYFQNKFPDVNVVAKE